MVKMLKIILFILFFLLALIYFVPKSSLYYYGEQNLEKEHIVINNETLKESLFQLDVQNFELYYNNIESVNVKNMSFTLLVLSNNISLQDIKLNSIVQDFLPLSIETITVHQDIFNPLVINLNAKGAFGVINGTFHLLEKQLKMTLNPSKQMLQSYKKSLLYFKKEKQGTYSYAKTF